MSGGMKPGSVWGVAIILVLLASTSLEEAQLSQLQWTEGVSARLLRGEVLTYRGYSVEVVSFPSPVESARYAQEPEEPVEAFVGLNISKDGRFISTVGLGLGESYIVPNGEIKVTAKDLPAKNAREWLFESYAPWAVIELNPRGIPNLIVSVQTDRDRYISSYATDIVATVKLENTGSADAVNVDMAIDTVLPVKRGRLKYHYDRIKRGESVVETITFPSPILAAQRTYTISANVSGYDVLDAPYSAGFSKSISIAAEVPVDLTIRKSTVEKMYLKDYTIVSLSVKNSGRREAKNITIKDYLPEGMRLLGNQTLQWVIDLPPNGDWDFRYLVRPQEANKEGVVFPSATAEFIFNNEFYSVHSNQPKIVVYGPKIVLSKETDVSLFNPGDTVTVTVTAENTESTPTRVTIMDTLPDNVALISGSTSLERFLEATMKVSFNYTIRIDSRENVILPSATAEYFELGSKGRTITAKSREVELHIKSGRITPSPTPEITATTPVPTITTPLPTPKITVTTPLPTPTAVEKKNYTALLNDIFDFLFNFSRQGVVEEGRMEGPNVSMSKSAADSMLLKDFTGISLSVENNGSSAIKVNVTDALPDSFRLLGIEPLQWVVEIPAKGTWEHRYLVRPQKPSKDGIVFPAATSEFTFNNELYTITSNQPRIVVYGAEVVLTKQTDVSEVKYGETATVTVVAENAGNAPTRIIISDELPQDTALTSGSTAYEGFLEANTKASFKYAIRITSTEDIKLPAAIAEYYEFGYKGRTITVKSQEPEIKVR